MQESPAATLPRTTVRTAHLRLHGLPELHIDGAPVALQLKRAVALLAYLSELRRRVARTALAVMLWPDTEESVGRTRLRRLVHRINGTAGVELVAGDGDALWIAGGELVMRSDVGEVRDAAQALLATSQRVEQGTQQASRFEVGGDSRASSGADSRHDGGPKGGPNGGLDSPHDGLESCWRPLLAQRSHCLLDGFSLPEAEAFEQWLALRRAEHERLVQRALRYLAEWLMERGQPREAAEVARRLLAIDPCAEAGHGLLMRALGGIGDAAAVAAAYADCVQRLQDEFGVPPSPALEASREAALAALSTARVDGRDAPRAPPPIRYAEVDNGSVAFVDLGHGDEALVLVPGLLSHLEVSFDEPRICRVLDALASRRRVLLLDRRGTGLSERVGVAPTAQAAVADILAVLDRAGVARAWLFGMSACGAAAIEAAVRHPERVSGLLLMGANVRGAWAPDYPWALDARQMEKWLTLLQAGWGQPTSLRTFAPSGADDPGVRAWWARMLRHATSPNGMATLVRAFWHIDVRPLLPQVRVPTLVMHREGDRAVRVGVAHCIAATIPGARLAVLPGEDHFYWHGDSQAVVDHIEAFIAEHSQGPAAQG